MRRARIAIAVAAVAVAGSLQLADAAVTVKRLTGRSISLVKIVKSDARQEFNTTSDAWIDLPGAQTSVSVPDGSQGFVTVRVTGAMTCDNNRVHIRAVVGGVEAGPSTVNLPCWGILYEPISFERSRGLLPPGAYTVKVQWSVEYLYNEPPEHFVVDNWHMTAEVVTT
jgi:hypothetical protein